MVSKNGALTIFSGISALGAIGSFIAAKDPRTCYQHDVLAWTTCTDVQGQYMGGAIALGIFAAVGLGVAFFFRAKGIRARRKAELDNYEI